MKIGIIGAMHEEVMLLKEKLTHVKHSQRGARTYYEGTYANHDVVLCLSGWGKSAAAATTSCLIEVFEVELILFVGLAGSLQSHVKIGDIVIGNELTQHDMDLREFSMLGAILPPFYRSYRFKTSERMLNLAKKSTDEFQLKLQANSLTEINQSYSPNIHVGEIGTGDQFVSSEKMKQHIIAKYPALLCTEMEGAAIAQIAHDSEVEFLIIRVISDNAADEAHSTFTKFLFNDIGHISVEILQLLLKNL